MEPEVDQQAESPAPGSDSSLMGKASLLLQSAKGAVASGVQNVGSRLSGSVSALRRTLMSTPGVPSEVLIRVNEIVEDPLFASRGELPQGVADIGWGLLQRGSTDRSKGAFYRLHVEEKHAANGFIVRISSHGRFKAIVFDKGVCQFNERSSSTSGVQQSIIYSTPFDTYSYSAENAVAVPGTPHVFSKLQTFEKTDHSLGAGHYLLCVIADGMPGLTRTDFTVAALPLPTNAESSEVVAADATLIRMKSVLDEQRKDFILKKEAFEAAREAVQAAEVNARSLDEDVNKLLHTRERAYFQLLKDAGSPYNIDPPVNRMTAAASTAAAAASSAASSAASVGSAAASQASAARSWLSKSMTTAFSWGNKGSKDESGNGLGSNGSADDDDVVVIGSETNLPADEVPSSPGATSSTTDASAGADAAEAGVDKASLSPWSVGARDPASPSAQEIEDALSGDGEK